MKRCERSGRIDQYIEPLLAPWEGQTSAPDT